MDRVAVTLKIMPVSADTDLDAITEGIKNTVSKHPEMQLKGVEKRPIAFGLKAIEILLVLPDSSISSLEDELTKIEGVASVEAGDVTLI